MPKTSHHCAKNKRSTIGRSRNRPLFQRVSRTPKRAENFQIPSLMPGDKYSSEGKPKDAFSSFEMRLNPTDPKSKTYTQKVPFFENGTVKEWLHVIQLLELALGDKVDLADVESKYLVYKSVLRGQALRDLESKHKEIMDARPDPGTDADGNPNAVAALTDDELTQCVQNVAKGVFPKNALNIQKNFMLRHSRKQSHMKARDYINDTVKINDWLENFPPNFDESQKFNDAELVELLHHAFPNSYKGKLIEMGFDVAADDRKKLLEKVEICETLERMQQTKAAGSAKYVTSEFERYDARDYETSTKTKEYEAGRGGRAYADVARRGYDRRKKYDGSKPYPTPSGKPYQKKDYKHMSYKKREGNGSYHQQMNAMIQHEVEKGVAAELERLKECNAITSDIESTESGSGGSATHDEDDEMDKMSEDLNAMSMDIEKEPGEVFEMLDGIEPTEKELEDALEAEIASSAKQQAKMKKKKEKKAGSKKAVAMSKKGGKKKIDFSESDSDEDFEE